jgi:beta-glucosidase
MCLFIAVAFADEPIYKDLNRSFQERAADLVSRMTLEEKVAQLQNDAPAIPRLDVPAYEWWNEALHGVARAGPATVFPQAIGISATFDVPLMTEIATVISDEARAKHHDFARRDQRKRYQGLTFWSPNINIFRDPRWGRGQGLTAKIPGSLRMGVAFVKAMQGDDPKYRKVDATAKHFAVHSGPEADRHHFDVYPSERDLWETYLPAFRALVQEGHVASVMGAYNRINGESASGSFRLLTDILRTKWGFRGYVVSDCDSIDDIWKYHKIVATPEEAAAIGITAGLEVNCGKTTGPSSTRSGRAWSPRWKSTRPRGARSDALPARHVRSTFPGEVGADSLLGEPVAAHDVLSRKVARESLVLLKNTGVLPLDKSKLRTIAVVGPTADEIMSLLGNYYGAGSP